MATKKTTIKPKTVTKPKAKTTVKPKTKTAPKKPATKAKAEPKKVASPKTPVKKKTAKKAVKKPKAVEPINVKTKAELLCEGVSPEIKAQAITLANAVLTMQEKIEQQTPKYKDADLAQEVTLGTGEKVLRPNPLTQEFRATVRDYATALNNLDEILNEKKAATEVSPVKQLRNKFKVG